MRVAVLWMLLMSVAGHATAVEPHDGSHLETLLGTQHPVRGRSLRRESPPAHPCSVFITSALPVSSPGRPAKMISPRSMA